jgi:hypothetical protein
MRRPALIAFGVTMLAGLLLALVISLTHSSRLVYTLSVAPAGPVADLAPGRQACQGTLELPEETFDRIVVGVGRGGQPIDVVVRSLDSRRVLTRGHLAAAHAPESAVAVAPLKTSRRSEICVRNAGRRSQQLMGQIDLANRTSSATVEGAAINADLALRLERRHPRSLLARMPQIAAHAGLFKASWIGTWTIWLLGGLVVIAVPLLLARAVADATRDGA